jgi:ubiquinone/menaquinone biosynthesis C-methylase UbiE
LTRRIQLRELLLGIEGLALLRQMFVGDDEEAMARITEVRRLVAEEDDATFGLSAEAPELTVREGYAAWSATYDRPGNPLIATEQPVVWRILDDTPPGRALDAACGTGRHTRRLVDCGHSVIGVDGSPEMLAVARVRAPEATFADGDLQHLPVASDAFDLVVCSLAFDHVPNIDRPVAELARVLRPGGRLVVSDIHPVLTAIGGAAYFRDADGVSAFMRNYGHVHSEYLQAFAAAGLSISRCHEPRFGEEAVWAQGLGMAFVPEATRAAYYGMPGALVWELVRSSA